MKDDAIRFITVEAAAREMSVSRWSVYRLIWENEIRSVKIGRSRRVVYRSLLEYMNSLESREY